MRKTISASVGQYGVNQSTDVMTVQQLLNNIPVSCGGPVLPIPVTGYCGEQTKAAIRQFQVIRVRKQDIDGRVDPGSSTWCQLLQFQSLERPAPAPPTEEFLIRPLAVEDQLYEVSRIGDYASSLYWLGVPPRPARRSRTAQTRLEPLRVTLPANLPTLNCPATYTTRCQQGTIDSHLKLLLPCGSVDISMPTHLRPPRSAGAAILAGLFQKVG